MISAVYNISVSAPMKELIIRLVIVLLGMMLQIAAFACYTKVQSELQSQINSTAMIQNYSHHCLFPPQAALQRS